MSDPIDAIENIIKAGDDPWEALVSAGIQASDSADDAKFIIGDAALLVAKEYGKDRIGEFAYVIKREKARVMEYRGVCRFWHRQNSARVEIRTSYPVITYTHLRDSMRLKEYEAAMDFIMECVANDWGVEKARMELNERLGKPLPPIRYVDAEAVVEGIETAGLVGSKVTFVVDGLDDGMDVAKLIVTERYRLVVYEVKEDSDV